MTIDVQAAKTAFDREGFAVLKGFLSPGEVAEVLDRLDRYIREIVPTLPSHDVLYEDRNDPASMFRLERMEHYDPYFKGLFLDDRFLTLARTFLEDDIAPRGVELFGKAPRVGNPTPPHQDGYYFMLDPQIAMTFWVALDKADDENGCIRYVRGSHRRGMRPHALSNVLGFSQGIVDYAAQDAALEAAVPVDPGDVIAHHSMTIHRTDANPSDRPRRALGFVYFGQSAKVDREGQQAYQKALFEKWKQEGKI
jgi:phytanoyl-CoA hydroxylase